MYEELGIFSFKSAVSDISHVVVVLIARWSPILVFWLSLIVDTIERVHIFLDHLLCQALCLADEDADSNDQQDDQQGQRPSGDSKDITSRQTYTKKIVCFPLLTLLSLPKLIEFLTLRVENMDFQNN